MKLASLSLLDWKISEYRKELTGPVRPGNDFFDWLISHPSPQLQIPIPDTIVIGDASVHRVYNDGKNVTCEKVAVDHLGSRDDFMLRCIDTFIKSSDPITEFDSLENRFVAVIKRPTTSKMNSIQRECNETEVLVPLGLQANLLNAFDFKLKKGVIIQKFIKCRGSKAIVYRLFWKAHSLGVGEVTGWALTKDTEHFQLYDASKQPSVKQNGNSVYSDGLGLESTQLRNGLRERDVILGKYKKTTDAELSRSAPNTQQILSAERDAEFLDGMAQKLDLTRAERQDVLHRATQIHRQVGRAALCSLQEQLASSTYNATTGTSSVAGDGSRQFNDITKQGKIVATRVSTSALEEVQCYIERLVQWIQSSIQKEEHLVLQLSDIVCDFIRDSRGNWWFIQVPFISSISAHLLTRIHLDAHVLAMKMKGFAISKESEERVKLWRQQKLEHEGYEVNRPIPRPLSAAERRQKLERERGYKCRMCGLSFTEGRLIRIEMEAAPHLDGGDGVGHSSNIQAQQSIATSTATITATNNHSRFLSVTSEPKLTGRSKTLGSSYHDLDASSSIQGEPVDQSHHQQQQQQQQQRYGAGMDSPLHSGAVAESRTRSRIGVGADIGIDSLINGESSIYTPSLDQLTNQEGSKTASAYGYSLSSNMACKLAELYRDAKYPLTKCARDVLLGNAELIEARTTAVQRVSQVVLDARKNRHTYLSCCFFCAQIVDEHARYLKAVEKLHVQLGISVSGLRTRKDSRGAHRAPGAAAAAAVYPSASSTRSSSGIASRIGKFDISGIAFNEEDDMRSWGTAGNAGNSAPLARIRPRSAGSRPLSAGSRSRATRLAGGPGSTGGVGGRPGQSQSPSAGSFLRARPDSSEEARQDSLRQSAEELQEIVAATLRERRRMELEKTLTKGGCGAPAQGSLYASPEAAPPATAAEIRLQKLSRSALPPSETAAFLDSVTKTHSSSSSSSSKVSSYIGVSEGGFTHQRWTAQHLKRGAHQWRMFVMAHFLTDIRSVASQASRKGSVGCIAYTLGPVVSTMPFQHEVSAGLSSSHSQAESEAVDHSPIIWVRQCRLHYFCATTEDAKKFFSRHSLDFQLFYSAAATERAHRMVDHGSGPVCHWEGSFQVSLQSLRWASEGATVGTEKIDILVPLELRTLGIMSLKLSVAIICDDPLPRQLADVKAFEREEGIFWPPLDYRDDSILPDAWIAMLTAATTQEQDKDSYQEDQRSRQEAQEKALMYGAARNSSTRPGEDDEDEDSDTSEVFSSDEGVSDTSRILKAALHEDNRSADEVDAVVEQLRGVFNDLLKVTQLQRRLSVGLKAQRDLKKQNDDDEDEDSLRDSATCKAAITSKTATAAVAVAAAKTGQAVFTRQKTATTLTTTIEEADDEEDRDSNSSDCTESDEEEVKEDEVETIRIMEAVFRFLRRAGDACLEEKPMHGEEDCECDEGEVRENSRNLNGDDGKYNDNEEDGRENDDEYCSSPSREDRSPARKSPPPPKGRALAAAAATAGRGDSSPLRTREKRVVQFDSATKLSTTNSKRAAASQRRTKAKKKNNKNSSSDGSSNQHGKSEGLIIMMLAVEQLLQMEYLPRWLTWGHFYDYLSECLTWATIQRDKIKFAAKQGHAQKGSRLKEKPSRGRKRETRRRREISPQRKSGTAGSGGYDRQAEQASQHRTGGKSSCKNGPDETETAFSDHIMLSAATGTQSLIDSEELIMGLAQRMRGTELDYQSNRTERTFPLLRKQIERKILASRRVIGSAGGAADTPSRGDDDYDMIRGVAVSSSPPSSAISVYAATVSPLDLSVLYRPSSMDRKKRRLLFYASVFNVVAHGTDMIDVAELKAFLKSERDQFCKLLALIKDGTVTMPIISRGYNRQEVEGAHAFSVVRALICCHLWNSSTQLHKLFENFDEQGLAVVSLTGFIRAAESCFLTVSDNLGTVDDVLADFVDLAVKDASFRRAPVGFVSREARAIAAAVSSAAAAMARGSILGERRGSRLGSIAQTVKSKGSTSGRSRSPQDESPILEYDPEEAPPTVYLRCEYHGAEDFFFADLCCCKCEDEAWKASRQTK